MSDAAHTGHANGRSTRELVAYMFAAFSAFSGMAALGKSAIDDVEADRKSMDDAIVVSLREDRERINDLLAKREGDAYNRGISDQKLAQLADLSQKNSERIEAAFKELDTKLQREMQLADVAISSGLVDLDNRLQGEIAVSRSTRADQIGELRERLDGIARALEVQRASGWTKEDQRRFEDQLGLRVRPEQGR